MPLPPTNATIIRQRVEVALANRFRCELGSPATGKALNPEERRQALTVLFTQLALGMGMDRFQETPVERLDQFAVMSVLKNHDTAGMLRSLLNSFMIAYGCPETADRAFAALLELEALRAEIADAKGQPTRNPVLLAAAADLESVLTKKLPQHTAAQPLYRILFGADRLLVMAASPIQDLPAEINGVPIEFRAHSAVATHH